LLAFTCGLGVVCGMLYDCNDARRHEARAAHYDTRAGHLRYLEDASHIRYVDAPSGPRRDDLVGLRGLADIDDHLDAISLHGSIVPRCCAARIADRSSLPAGGGV
jgi:hypothetical protein